MRKILSLIVLITLLSTYPASADDSQRIINLEKKVAALEAQVLHLRAQEARANKYLKCIQGVKGNYITIPIRLINCIRN